MGREFDRFIRDRLARAKRDDLIWPETAYYQAGLGPELLAAGVAAFSRCRPRGPAPAGRRSRSAPRGVRWRSGQLGEHLGARPGRCPPSDYIDQVFNQHNPSKAANFVTGNVVWHGNSLGDIAGAENLAGLLGSFIGALPDLFAAEQDITAENNLVHGPARRDRHGQGKPAGRTG